ncbi:MAG: NADH-dependent dehydrogenase [Armatimonadota bacterium]|nr:MAG: NADH-dependent dehydrogenase [Armatimonadota bacterium]
MSQKMDRRTFLKGAALGGLSFLFLRDSRLAFAYQQNEKLNIAMIGAGGRGRGNLDGVLSENIVALCDVDERLAYSAQQACPKAKFFQDFRKMLEQMRKEIDAVVVSTPDHTHAVAAAMAIRMGKHVYCEKPLTRTIWEARMLRDLARRYKVATQMGNQGTASNELRQGVEVIQSGVLGQVKEIHVWSNRPVWPQGIARPKEEMVIPDGLNWELWLGPAPKRPYHEAYHPFKWRGWIDFGTGAIGDMACHTMNMAFWALNLRDPISVEAETSGVNGETFPQWSIVRYEFPQRGDLAPCKLVWYDGGQKPPAELLQGEQMADSGLLLIGSEGTLYSPGDYGTPFVLLPREKFANYQPPAPSIPRSPGHHQEWINACKGGPAAMSNFDYASALTETALLGNLAIITGERIQWDAKRMKAVNCPKADKIIRPTYRKGWTL